MKKWMMKNAPGSPGSICKNFGKVFGIKKTNNPFVNNGVLFEEIIKGRYPFMHYDKVKFLSSIANDNFLLFILALTIYQSKNKLWALENEWTNVIEAIYEIGIEKFGEFVDMDLLNFTLQSEQLLFEFNLKL
jgi:hypothetical protein